MKFGCTLALAAFAGLSYGYYRWVGISFDAPWCYILPGVGGLLTVGALSALRMGRAYSRDAAIAHNSDWSVMPRDGERAAISGTIEAIERPMIAPLSGRDALVYEYEITRAELDENGKRVGADFTGIGMTRCVIRGESRTVELHGYPLLEHLPFQGYASADDTLRARRYVSTTQWTDCTGMKLLSGAASMFSSITDDERDVRRDWRIISAANCEWLDPAKFKDDGRTIAPAARDSSDDDDLEDEDLEEEENDLLKEGNQNLEDEEDEIDEDDSEESSTDSYSPLLFEKRLEPGDRITVLGYYDPSRFALVSRYAGGTLGLTVFRDEPAQVVKKLRSKSRESYVGAIILLLIVHVACFGANLLFRINPKTQETWRNQCLKAMNEQNLAKVKRSLDRGLSLDPVPGTGRTLLHEATNAEITKLLIARGIPIDSIDSQGHTALHEAVIQDRIEVVRALLAAGADRTRRDLVEKRTPLEMAQDRGRVECAAALAEEKKDSEEK